MERDASPRARRTKMNISLMLQTGRRVASDHLHSSATSVTGEPLSGGPPYNTAVHELCPLLDVDVIASFVLYSGVLRV